MYCNSRRRSNIEVWRIFLCMHPQRRDLLFLPWHRHFCNTADSLRLMIPVAREVAWICVAVLCASAIPFVADETTARDSIGSEEIAWAQPELCRTIPPFGSFRKYQHHKEKYQQENTNTHCRFRMATAVLRRPLLAALLLPAGAGTSGPSSRFRLRRRRSPPSACAVSSDSPKPVASTSSSAGGDSPEEEPPVLPLLQELAVRRRASSSV